MKYLLICLVATQFAFSQEMPKKVEEATAVSMKGSDKSVIIIDPKMRAKDLVQAYSILRKEKPTLKVMVETTTGSLMGVSDISASDGGTLLLIKMMTNQGIRTHIVPVEQIMEIAYSP